MLDRQRYTCYIAPPDLLSRMTLSDNPDRRDAAAKTAAASASMRTRRSLLAGARRTQRLDVRALVGLGPVADSVQTVYDVEHQGRSALPGQRKRGTGDPTDENDDVNAAYDNTQSTYDFYLEVYDRESLDGESMELVSSVHYGVAFDNAFWDGAQMVYGDGSGQLFQVGSLVRALDVVAHELAHGVTDFTAGLVYSKQSGALNEHMSDVFGSLVKQHRHHQTADQADWLLGNGTLVPELGTALRSLKEPGTAFAGDRQPAHMDDYADLPDDNDPDNDNGGVHINSGIPNHAFYLLATSLGGYAWEKAGRIWYVTLTQKLTETSTFNDAAGTTAAVAKELFGPDEANAVADAWREVGLPR